MVPTKSRTGGASRFEARVARFIRTRRLVEPGERVLLAVSGGPDSMALLDVMAALAPRFGIGLAVAHLDHGLRGDEGAADAEFVRGAARRLGLPARIEKRSVVRGRGESLEMAARRVRYAFLEEAAEALGCARIATGHTADDQAETVLMRLFRGAGPRGLSGIPAVRALGQASSPGSAAEPRSASPRGGPDPRGASPRPCAARVIRPLLGEPRAAILAYLAERGVAYRTDATNAEPWSVRNRVRAEILPRIAALANPGIARTLGRHAEREEAIARHLEREAARLLADLIVCEEPGRIALSAAGLAATDPALRPVAVRLAIERVALSCDLAGAVALRVGEAHLSACVALATERPGRRSRPLPAGLQARRVGDRVEFLAPRTDPPGFRLLLDVPGRVFVPPDEGAARVAAAARAAPPPATLTARLVSPADRAAGRSDGGPGAFAVEFDWRALRPPIEVRSRRPGDRIAPRGMAGRKTLQDLMVDRKVPWTERGRVPIVADRDRILWVVGLAVSREAPVTAETREALRLTFEASDSARGDR